MATARNRTVAEEIRSRLDRLTPAERRPARTLLANYPMAGLETVAQLARTAGVSGASVMRLVSKLGFASYPEFQQALRAELQARILSPLAKGGRTATRSPARGHFLERFAAVAIANIETTAETLAEAEFERAARLLADRRRPLHLIGGRLTEGLATYLYRHLRAIRPNVRLLEGQPAVWPDALLDMGRRDVIVAFDVRRYRPDLLAFAERAVSQGATLVLFTDQWLSPIAQVARHVLPAHVEAPSHWDSAAAILVLAEALIARVNELAWPAVKVRMEQLEAWRENGGGTELQQRGTVIPRAGPASLANRKRRGGAGR